MPGKVRSMKGEVQSRDVRTRSSFVLRPSSFRAGCRRGISLLEVLISMFVLLIGLVGVMSLIPVGRSEMGKGLQSERASAIGQAAFRDIKVRGMLDPSRWRDRSNNAVYTASSDTLNPVMPYAFDPLAPTAWTQFPKPGGIQRLTITGTTTDNFVMEDELVFTRQGDQLPNGFYSKSSTGDPIKRQSEGNYSWLFTVVPDPLITALTGEKNNTNSVRANGPYVYTVSVAVFYKRVLAELSDVERSADVEPLGGGTFRLLADPIDEKASETRTAVKAGQWLMLAGKIPGAATPPPTDQFFYKWYRILSADDKVHIETPRAPADQPRYVRDVTLAGADWQVDNVDPSPPYEVEAWLFDGIVAVYEKQMRLETP